MKLTGNWANIFLNGQPIVTWKPPSIGVVRKPDENDAQFRARITSFQIKRRVIHFLSKLGIKKAQGLQRDTYVEDSGNVLKATMFSAFHPEDSE